VVVPDGLPALPQCADAARPGLSERPVAEPLAASRTSPASITAEAIRL